MEHKLRLTKRLWLIVAWCDGWVGYYWNRERRHLYLFPIPWFGVRIDCGEMVLCRYCGTVWCARYGHLADDIMCDGCREVGYELEVEAWGMGDTCPHEAADSPGIEGVTIPRKVALALALVSAGRWSIARLQTMLYANDAAVGRDIFAALGVSEDEAFEEMKEDS